MTQTQFITVPILDARLREIKMELRALQDRVDAKLDAIVSDVKFEAMLARLDARFAALEARLKRWIFLMMLVNVAVNVAAKALVFKSL